MAKRGRGKRQGRISFKVPPKVQKVLKEARAARVRTVRVIGQIKGGVLQIREAEVAAVARKAGTAGVTFVALNAPFKTRATTGSL